MDDMDLESLEQAAANNLAYLNRLTQGHTFQYGPHRYSRDQVMESQKALLDILKDTQEQSEIRKKIKKNFMLYRAAGRVGKKGVLFTGYFEPTY
ncbi:MAG: hypothetical protein JXL81_13830, partial [Deltaproteobacteria bacterium]|nr:hypothetical protein [Deltaproteobacteria bacterium]